LQHHDDDVVGLGIACNGKYIMSCSEKNDLILWDLKGEQLAKVDTYLMTTICARISPCARFVAASGTVHASPGTVTKWQVLLLIKGFMGSM
jgi:mRNA-capping enzyme